MTILKMHDTDTVTIGTREYLTRHWYMDGGREQGYDGAERHKRFYAQFATPQVRAIVSNFFNERSGPSWQHAQTHTSTVSLSCPSGTAATLSRL